MLIYYIYAYIRKSNGTPYYIGKGSYNRMNKQHTFVSVPKDKSKIVLLETNLTEIGALALERRLISWWGRKDLGTGILLNKTDGGEGVSGLKMSAESRKKMSEAALNRTAESKANIANSRKYNSEETKKKMSESAKRRLPMTEETKKKLSLIGKNYIFSDEHKQNITEAKLKKYDFITPFGFVIEHISQNELCSTFGLILKQAQNAFYRNKDYKGFIRLNNG